MRTFLFISLSFILGCAGGLRAQGLVMVSGNGQVVQSQMLSSVPMVVEATNASGQPAAGVTVSWKITTGSGTLVRPTTTTGANGQAGVTFLATNVPGNLSFFPSTITATTGFGSVNFVVTTALLETSNGNSAPPPLVTLVAPPQTDLSLTGAQGSTLAAAVVVKVNALVGPQSGFPIPNVGLRIANDLNPTAIPPAACTGLDGLVLTAVNTGIATCNLMITGAPGSYQLTAVVGEYQLTTPFALTITQGQACSFSLSSTNQSFPASGGAGTVSVSTTSGCGWTAASNSSFIALTSGATGTGDGTASFSVAANAGAARTGTLTIAGQTFTVNQSGGVAGALAITTPPALAPGNIGSTYSVSLAASGGTPPYKWTSAGTLPPGLTLNSTQGVISGTPTTAGTYGFTLTVTDSAGATQSQGFAITISQVSTSGLSITNAPFPAGAVGQPYQQLLTTSGACVSPFSPSPAFSVTGGALPGGLSIQTNSDFTRSIVGTPTAGGVFNFTLTATDACDFTATANFSITINSTSGPASMSVSLPSISFTVQAGTTNLPSPQTIALSSTTTAALNYNATVTTQSGGNWLAINGAAGGSTPASLTIGLVNFANLVPGPYTGSVTIRSQASNSPVVVPVNLTVVPTPNLTVGPKAFTVTQIGSSGSTTTREAVMVTSGSATSFIASATTQSGGNWLSVDPGSVTGVTPAEVVAVINAAGLSAGTYNGTLSITPAGGVAQTVAITLDVVAPGVIVATPAPISFSYQQGSSSPAVQTLMLNSTGAVLNVSIGAVTNSGSWLSVSPTSASTPMNVNVSVNPTGLAPATYQGTINIAASDPTVTPLAVQVTLTVTKPVAVIASVTNAASFDPGPVSPGEFITIFGTSLGPYTPVQLELDSTGKVAATLGGTQVFFDNTPARMVYSSSGQISLIVPYEVATESDTSVRVEYLGSVSAVFPVRVIASAPGIFVANASGQGAIDNQDGSPNSAKNGAEPGSVVSVFATGEGQTDPPGVDGVINASALPLPKPLLAVTAEINGEAAEVTYAGAAPGQVAGILQVNVRVPADVPKGTSVPVSITVGAATSQAGVTLAIHP